MQVPAHSMLARRLPRVCVLAQAQAATSYYGCVCLLLQDLLQSCSRGGEEESGRHVL